MYMRISLTCSIVCPSKSAVLFATLFPLCFGVQLMSPPRTCTHTHTHHHHHQVLPVDSLQPPRKLSFLAQRSCVFVVHHPKISWYRGSAPVWAQPLLMIDGHIHTWVGCACVSGGDREREEDKAVKASVALCIGFRHQTRI